MNVTPGFFRCACCVLAGAMVVAVAIPAAAQTVLVDFGSSSLSSYRGLSVINPDSNGNYWTSFTPGDYAMDLVDITNTPTNLDLGFSTNIGTDSYNGPAGPVNPLDPNDKEALRTDYLPFTDIDDVALGPLGGALEGPFDFFVSPGDPYGNLVRFEIQELDLTKTYDLTFFGSHAFSTDTTTVYSVYTDNTYTTLVDSATLDVQDDLEPWFHNRDTLATISGLSPQTDNILYIEFIGSEGGFGYLNALQIDINDAPAVPGDYNGNGTVDAADFTVWRDNLGGDAGASFAADTRNPILSGPVGNDDYTFWKQEFIALGSGAVALGVGAALPEPSTFGLILSAFALALACRRRFPTLGTN